MKKNSLFTITCLLALVFSACNSGSSQESSDSRDQARQEKPNVIIIYADDLGYGDLSSYGAQHLSTPNIDTLASEGLQFTNAHSTAATCTPSRYSLMTGEYAFRKEDAHILPGNASLLISQDQATLGTVFQKAGYTTASIGKWHLGLGPEEGPDWNGAVKPGPNEVGFDYSFIFPATADRVPTVFLENHKVIALEKQDSLAVSYDHKVGDEPTGKEHPELLKMKASHGHDGTIVNGIGRIGWMSGGKSARWTDEELSDTFLARSQHFIEENKGEPFFLYYAINEIHVPRMPATRFKGKSKLGYRGDVILEMDHLVGELMKTLKANKLAQNTIVIFTSDNGPVLDDGYIDASAELAEKYDYNPAGSFRGGKYSLLEGGTRMPFIVHWPEKIKPGKSDALISQMDLLASFAEMHNINLSGDDAVDSENMLNVLLGRSKTGRETYVEQNNGAALAYIKDGWKYIGPHSGPSINKAVNIETGLSEEPQLYNLKKDKAEQHNLAEKYPKKIKQMAKELEQLKNGKR